MKKTRRKLFERLCGCLDELLFPGSVLCLSCRQALQADASEQLCSVCLETLERLARMQEERERTIPMEWPKGIDYVHAAFPYEGPARRLVHRLKYDSIRAAHIYLACTMALLPSGEEEIIVPVPTDSERLRQRGYNQAELLARHIGRTLGMEVATALVRKEYRPPQTGLCAEMRRLNMVGCMAADSSVSGRRVLLVDDVYTTGATVQEAARALRKAGATGVGVFVAAIASEETNGEKEPFPLALKSLNRAKKLKIPDKNRGEL